MCVLVALLISVAATYQVMVAVCVAARMSPQSSHGIRALVLGVGGLACWALLRTAAEGWHGTPQEILLAAGVLAGAFILAAAPRLKT